MEVIQCVNCDSAATTHVMDDNQVLHLCSRCFRALYPDAPRLRRGLLVTPSGLAREIDIPEEDEQPQPPLARDYSNLN